MSNRYLTWAEAWIEENIRAGANTDVENYEVKAKRLLKELQAEAVEARFKKFEIDEERRSLKTATELSGVELSGVRAQFLQLKWGQSTVSSNILKNDIP